MPEYIASRLLCDVCNSIFAKGSYDWWLKRKIYSDCYQKLPFNGMPKHHLSLESFSSAIVQGCWICVQLKKVLHSTTWSIELLRYSLYRHEEDVGFWYELSFFNSQFNVPISIIDFECRGIPPPDKLQSLAEASKSKTWTGDPAVAKLAKEWLLQCQLRHRNCTPAIETKWYPTRLLDLSKDTIRLRIISQGRVSGPYATLSHCWGIERFWVLTGETMSKLIRGVHLSKFPTTFQHAFTAVRRLGIDYLWIDCYCIIQGLDPQAQADWEFEAGRMGQVYSNTLINIAASRARGPVHGLFSNRPSYHSETLVLRWCPSAYDEESRYRLMISHPYGFTSKAFTQLCSSRLAKRGWFIQESVLCPRMLSFNGPDIFWQCSEAIACEDFPAQSVTKDVKKRDPFWALTMFADTMQTTQNMSNTLPINPTQNEQRLIRRIQERWCDTMSSYGQAVLTFPHKDVFKAIDGVAQRTAQLTSDTYQHGLLRKSMPQALLWHVAFNHGIWVPPPQGPTWHWAAWSGRVDFPWESTLYAESANSAWNCFSPAAYVFMSDDSKVFAQNGARDLWPCLMCIGRRMEVKIEEDKHEVRGRDATCVVLPQRFDCFPIYPRLDDGVALDGSKHNYVILPLVSTPRAPKKNSTHSPWSINSSTGKLAETPGVVVVLKGLLLQATCTGTFQRIGVFHVQYTVCADNGLWKSLQMTRPTLTVLE